jgi:hypothetical protein
MSLNNLWCKLTRSNMDPLKLFCLGNAAAAQRVAVRQAMTRMAVLATSWRRRQGSVGPGRLCGNAVVSSGDDDELPPMPADRSHPLIKFDPDAAIQI